MRTVRWVAVAVGLTLAVLFAVLVKAEPDVVAASPIVGRTAPEVSGAGLDGRRVALSSFRGRFVVVNFFATWCTPCQREHAELDRFARRHDSVGDAVVLSVVYDDQPAAVRSFFRNHGGDWPVVEDAGAKVDFGVRGVPESFLVDREGVVLQRIVGGVTARGLEGLIGQAKALGR